MHQPLVKTDESPFSAAVERSLELLSCAKSALKIAQQQSVTSPYASPNDIRLHQQQKQEEASPSLALQEDCVSLLRSMERELSTLNGLVRRSGQTNDPTNDISAATSRFEQDAAQLAAWLQQLLNHQDHGTTNGGRSRNNRRQAQQHKKHLTHVVEWCQAVGQEQAKRLQTILKLRAQVLKAQAKRRQQFTTAAGGSTATTGVGSASSMSSAAITSSLGASAATSAASLERNPLFAARPLQHNNNKFNNNSPHGISRTRNQQHAYGGGYGSSNNGGVTATASYGGGSYYGGGGGYNNGSSNGGMGMRQRRAGGGGGGAGNGYQNHQQQQDTQQQQQPAALLEQEQLTVRRQERATAERLRDARQTEQQLHTIGALFGKMSTLVQQQGETLTKVEEDVEAAATNVQAGQEEIFTVHAIKKGNRALILKVFGLLIFLILFLRLYKK